MGLPDVSREKSSPKSQILNPLSTKLFPSRWLDIGLILFSGYWSHSFITCFWIDPILVHKHGKNNSANVQSLCPHTWSITHISCMNIVLAYNLIFSVNWRVKRYDWGCWTIPSQSLSQPVPRWWNCLEKLFFPGPHKSLKICGQAFINFFIGLFALITIGGETLKGLLSTGAIYSQNGNLRGVFCTGSHGLHGCQ